MPTPIDAAAYGGPRWSPRLQSLQQEIGSIWAPCGVAAEWTPLRAVLLHRPGNELSTVAEPDAAQMLALPDAAAAAREHDALAAAFRTHGVDVAYVEPDAVPPPNQMFAADLFFMTASGAIIGRPASTVRAGEERWVARRLAALGVPILRTVAGNGTFEGADAMWLGTDTVLVGRGLRTNAEGAAQVCATLNEQRVRAIVVDLPHGAMHLMGQLRIIDRDLAFIRAHGLSWSAVDALRDHGYRIRSFPDEREIDSGHAHNVVTLAPRHVLMPRGNPATERAYRTERIDCVTVDMTELRKAAGAVGCLTGVLRRDSPA